MASIGFDNLIRVSVNANAYLGDSYDAARRSGDVGFAFLFDVLAVVGEGIWLNGSISTDPVPFPDSNPLAYLTYDLDRSFSVALTAEGRESIEQDVGSGYKLNIDYVMMYLADSPNVPAFAFGPNAFESVPPGAYALREGYMTEASGNQSHAEGYGTNARGDAAHSEGRGTTATGDWSHAEGQGTEAVGTYAHAEGYSTHARSTASHAEGYRSNAAGQYAHAEGYSSTASNTAAHAEGWGTDASKAYSHAQNLGTRAASDSQTALGKYNVEDANDDYAVIIGNGTSNSSRSNALTVGWDGSVEAAGDVDAGGGISTAGAVTVGGKLDVAGMATHDSHILLVNSSMDRDGAIPSSEQDRFIAVRDKDNETVAALRGVIGATTAGNIGAQLVGYGENSGGTTVANRLGVYVNRNGEYVYSLSDPAAFCKTLHVGDRVEKDQKTAVSMADSAWKNICSISLAAGTWIIEATGQYAANSTGRRYLAISETSASASAEVQRQTGNSMNAVSGGTTYIHTGCTKVLTATTTIYLVGWQNSGAALSTYGCITAVRIK